MRLAMWLVTLACGSALCPAQVTAWRQQMHAPPKLWGVARVQFLLAELSLTEAQMQSVRPLVEQHTAAIKAQALAAASLSEEQRAKLLMSQHFLQGEQTIWIRQDIAREAQDEKHDHTFVDQLRPLLTPPQLTRLDAALAFLAESPNADVRPVDVLRIAQTLNLTTEQTAQLRQIARRFRDRVSPIPLDVFEFERARLLTGLIADVRSVLNAAQLPRFDGRLAEMQSLSDRAAPHKAKG